MSNDNDKKGKDFTSILDLGEFEHSENTEINRQLSTYKDSPEGKGEKQEKAGEDLSESLPPSSPTPPPPPVPEEETEAKVESEVAMEDVSNPFGVHTDSQSNPFATFNTEVTEEPSFGLEPTHETTPSEPEPEPIPESIPEPIPELIPEPIPEPILESTPTIEPEATPEPPPPPPQPTKYEDFKEVKTFAENYQYGPVGKGGNPPFSIIIKNISSSKDIDEIVRILKECKIITNENESNSRLTMEQGQFLISQIGEYSAVFLCHQLRKLSVDLIMGLSDEIYPPKVPYKNPRGPVSAINLQLNFQESFDMREKNFTVNDVLLTTLSQLDKGEINHYLGIVSEHIFVSQEDLKKDETLNLTNAQKIQASAEEKESILRPHHHQKSVEERAQVDLNEVKLNHQNLYDLLAIKLKHKAFHLGGNAIVGVQYQLTPMNQEYQLTITGNVVYVRF